MCVCVCGWSDCPCFPAERFQNDLLELYEEPTIEEMEAALREMEEEEEEEEEGSLEFIEEDMDSDDGVERENEQKRKRKLQEESPRDSQRKKM